MIRARCFEGHEQMKPFEGVRVLDLTHVLAGPFCAHQLAMLGADVIKIEPPDRPDMTRIEGVIPEQNEQLYGTYFLSQNSGKRAITLDLRSDDGKEIMRKLIATADVLLQNYAGDALANLGVGYDDASAINPKLIYCSLTGFGRTGPKESHPAYDVVIQAFSGLMAGNGTADTGPIRVGPPMVDYGTGAQAALAISAALYQRDRTGTGQKIDVAMLDSALMLMSAMVTDTLVTGEAPHPHTNAHPAYAGYATFETADGLLMIGAWTNAQLARLLDVFAEHDRAQAIRDTPRSDVGNTRDEDAALIARYLREKPASDWEKILNDAHIPAARVRTLNETLTEDQLGSRTGIQNVVLPDGTDGPDRLPVAGYSYAHGGPSIDRPPPRFSEHTQEVLAELGYDEAAVAEFRQNKTI